MGQIKENILIVDDEPSIRDILEVVLGEAGYHVETVGNGKAALDAIKSHGPFDLLITDLRMPGMDGIELMEKVKQFDGEIETIIISAYADIKQAVRAIKLGAFDYLQKNFSTDELLLTVEKALERRHLRQENRCLKQKLENRYKFEDIVYESQKIKNICEVIERIAPTRASVLVTGESGVGKEVFARAIHKKSDRRDRPFVAINCSTLPDNLLESELFGHEKGSFTGAVARKIGKLELAQGGTVFLDEIAEISPFLQTKLLRFLQELEFERLGGLEKIKVDVRIIAATNKDLVKAIDSGEFREDLYYRLNVINLHIPPLRDRKQDIPLLAQLFLNQYNREYGRNINLISIKSLEYLMAYSWPGNVRELKNTMERAVAIADPKDDILLPRHLPPEILGKEIPGEEEKNMLSLAEFEKQHILNTLKRVNWNKSLAAQQLEINRQTLYNKMKQYGITKKIM